MSTSSSGSVASQYSGLTRLNGMASGMDIDGLVSKMMKAEAVPLDQMKQKQQTLQWKRDDYRDMNTSLKDLDTTIFDGVLMQSTFNKKTVSSSDESKVTATALSATGNMSAQISVVNLAAAASWKSSLSANTLPTTDTTLTFNVTDPGSSTSRKVSISIKGTDTLDNVISKFNNSDLGITMFKNSTGSLVMTNNKTGEGSVIQAVDDATKKFMNTDSAGKGLGFAQDTVGKLTFDSSKPEYAGKDAEIKLNGYTLKEKSNNFTINGVNYTIKGVTTSGSIDNPVNVSTATDVDAIFNSVKTFVDKYNDVIKKLNDKIAEKHDRSFAPLTDDQRAAMSDTDITKWETKAKTGLLSNDSILSSGLAKMRQNLYSPVTGSNTTSGYTQLAQIGIKTSADYSENGKLVVDETTLRQKIQDNPQAIYQLFAGDGTTTDTKGLARRLRDSISDTTDQITAIAGKATYTSSQFSIGKQLTSLGKQITDFQSKLTSLENRYYNQFSAMEKAMQQANDQSAYIAGQFSSGG